MFFKCIKKNTGNNFKWDDACEKAFQQLKEYLPSPVVLAKPVEGERLYLYVVVSPAAVNGVLVPEEVGNQKLIFYIRKTFEDTETRYLAIEKLALVVVVSARKLRPYFQSHPTVVLTIQPLRTVLHSPNQSGRLTKWAIELSEYDIEYRMRTCTKS